MSAFTFRRAPSVRWTPRLPDRHVTQERDDAHIVPPFARGVGKTSCGLTLPEGFALRLGARRHVSPRNPVSCPLEETALRQWCVRLQKGACPNETPTEAPVFVKRSR